MIYKRETFEDSTGRVVVARLPILQDVYKKTTYYGIGNSSQFEDENRIIEFDFPEGFTLEECFDKFDNYLKTNL